MCIRSLMALLAMVAAIGAVPSFSQKRLRRTEGKNTSCKQLKENLKSSSNILPLWEINLSSDTRLMVALKLSRSGPTAPQRAGLPDAGNCRSSAIRQFRERQGNQIALN